MIDARLQNLADNLPGGLVYQMVAYGQARRLLYVSRGVQALFGVSVEEAIADATLLYRCIDPAYLGELAKAEQRSLATGEPFIIEVPLSNGPKCSAWVQISSARRLGPDGHDIWDGVVLDITKRKEAELAHMESERRLELATEAASIGIWHWDLLGGELTYSFRAKAIYGFPPEEEITYEKLQALNVPEDGILIGPKLQRALDPTLRENEIYTYRIHRADTGEVRWLMAHGRATFATTDEGPRAISYVGTLQDITEQKRAEEATKESEARLKLAISAGEMAVWELDVKTETITPSPELNALYGFPSDAHPKLAEFRARYAPGERERIEIEAAEVLKRGGTQLNFETKHIWPDGTIKWFAIRAQIVNDAAGLPERVIGVVMDITQRRFTEDRLALVARELEHRVKNSLAVIQTLATQTFKPTRPYPDALKAFTGRLQALSTATDVITRTDWSNGSVLRVVEQVVGPYRDEAEDRFVLAGSDVAAPSKVVIGIGMAVHELCTNSLKYGALSGAAGKVSLSWAENDGWLDMEWREMGGPPVIGFPKAGFGTRLLRKGIFEGAAGSVDLQFLPTGVLCRIRAWMGGTER